MIIGFYGNYITNGYFDTGVLTPWTGTGSVVSDVKRSGSYSADVSWGTYVNQTFAAVAKSDISSFSLYIYGNAQIHITLFFSDLTSTDGYVWKTYPYDVWQSINLLTLVINPCSGALLFPNGKSVIGITIEGLYGTIYVDDVELIVNGLDVISWKESQNCNPAIKDVPLREDGAYVDVSTFTLKARILNITFRLTDSEKTSIETIFDAHTSITITAHINGDDYSWIYDAWLTRKPLVYEYRSRGGSNLKEWRMECEFKVRSFSYE